MEIVSRRLGDNKSLYRKLLLKFAAGYTLTADAIRQALDGGDFHEAHGLIHDLKALAGDLERMHPRGFDSLEKKLSDWRRSPEPRSNYL